MAVTPRSSAAALIPEEVTSEIIKNLPAQSSVLSLPNIRRRTASRGELEVPVMTLLPDAYWVEEGAVKQQSTAAWTRKVIAIRELATIVRFHENVLADTSYDLWGEIMPTITESIGQKIDQAVLFGIDAPSAFPESISEGCDRTDNEIEVGSLPSTPAPAPDFGTYVNSAFGKVEEDGYAVNGAVARLGVKAKLRGLRDIDGQPIFSTSLQDDGRVNSVYGEPLAFSANGSWEADDADMIVGDWSKLLFVVRQDMQMKITDTATVGGESLFERDEVALRVTFRCGFEVFNPPNRENDDDDTRYPFAAVRPAGWAGSSGVVS